VCAEGEVALRAGQVDTDLGLEPLRGRIDEGDERAIRAELRGNQFAYPVEWVRRIGKKDSERVEAVEPVRFAVGNRVNRGSSCRECIPFAIINSKFK
jgi:hypothetical protein